MIFVHAQAPCASLWRSTQAVGPRENSGTWTEGQSEDYTNTNLMRSRFSVSTKDGVIWKWRGSWIYIYIYFAGKKIRFSWRPWKPIFLQSQYFWFFFLFCSLNLSPTRQPALLTLLIDCPLREMCFVVDRTQGQVCIQTEATVLAKQNNISI
jgi:hypothetical protein